jgi:hypothetical protein
MFFYDITQMHIRNFLSFLTWFFIGYWILAELDFYPAPFFSGYYSIGTDTGQAVRTTGYD